MNILRQLWQDAQSVLRDMSVTQRVAVTFLVLTVAVWLTFAAWMGSTPGETGRRPLPMEADPADVNDILNQLRAKGITSAEYHLEDRRVIVNADEEKKAIIALAEQGLLRDAHAFGFAEMLDKWSFSDTRMRSEEAMRLARANEVARLIENLDGVRSAKVIYSDDVRRAIFSPAQKITAAVRVTTKLRKSLTEPEAETIISIVSAAKAGLDPRDVVVTDQNMNKFHTNATNGLSALAKRKWEAEFSLDEHLRRKLENLMRQYVPNIAFEGDVNAFPKHEIDFNTKEQTHTEILPGETLRKTTSSYELLSTRRPNEEPGVQPNARRVANLNNAGFWWSEETRESRKDSDVHMENSRRETAIRFAPEVKNLTISAIIHLPYRLKRDAEGRPVQAMNELGEPLIDPDTRQPMWERESTEPLTTEKMEELKRQIAQAAGIPLGEAPEKIEVSQVAWTPPVHAPRGGDAFVIMALNHLKTNMTAIITFMFFALAVYLAYRYATRPIPTEIEEHIEPETMSLALTTRDEDEEEGVDDEWDRLRSKATTAVQEDPKRAANLIKRWMRKD